MARYIDVNRYSFPTLHQKELNDYMKGWNACLKSVLQQPTADVEEVNKWIDVNERLPERDGETVLCYVQNSSTKGCTYVVGCIQQQKHWFLQTCNIGIATFPNHYWKVTHWMSLPEPPQIKE